MKKIPLIFVLSIFILALAPLPAFSAGKKVYKKFDDGSVMLLGGEEWREYDSDGRIIHFWRTSGAEEWNRYDSNGNLVWHKYRCTCGNLDEITYKYDSSGNIIYLEDTHGNVEKRTYDSAGRLTYELDSYGFEWRYTYDSKGKLLRKSAPSRLCGEVFCEYDSAGNIIHENSFSGVECWYKYDSSGNKIYLKTANGTERWFEYDSKGRKIHEKDIDGKEKWFAYDANGNKISEKSSKGEEYLFEYDSAGHKTYEKDPNGNETWWEYDSHGNLIHSREFSKRMPPSFNAKNWNPCRNEDGYEKIKRCEYEYDASGNIVYYAYYFLDPEMQ